MVADALARPAALALSGREDKPTEIAGIALLADGESVSAAPFWARSIRAPPFRDSDV